jgi:hypothetical protein
MERLEHQLRHLAHSRGSYSHFQGSRKFDFSRPEGDHQGSIPGGRGARDGQLADLSVPVARATHIH